MNNPTQYFKKMTNQELVELVRNLQNQTQLPFAEDSITHKTVVGIYGSIQNMEQQVMEITPYILGEMTDRLDINSQDQILPAGFGDY